MYVFLWRLFMNFYSSSELRTKQESIWKSLSKDDVVITRNGKPCALIIGIPEGSFDETIRALRQARAISALNRMRSNGFMSVEEIDEAVI